MSGKEQQQGQEVSAGFFGRIWGSGGKRKAVKANLGDSNQLFYDEKLKRWRKHGEEVSESDLEPPPPPILGSGFSTRAGEAQANKRTASSSRYAEAGGFGKSQSSASSAGAFLPRPSTAPSTQAPFLPKAGGGGAPGAPKFFIPGGGGGAASGATEAPAAAAPWGFSGAGNTQPPTPRSGHTTPVAQSPVSKPRSPQSEPPLARPRGFQPSEDTGNEQLSWQQWRQQDEDRREEERRQAAEVGAQIMESFTQTGTPSNTAADSFGDAQEPAGGSNGWPTGVSREESVGDNMREAASSATLGAWMGGPTPAIDEEGGDSTSADLLGQPSLVEGDSPAQEDPLEPTQPTGGDGLEEVQPPPADGADAPESWGYPANWEGGNADGLDGTTAWPAQDGAWEQTYGGYTLAQLQEWAEQYKQQGSSEEEVQTWLESYLAAPDPPPGEGQDYDEGQPAEGDGLEAIGTTAEDGLGSVEQVPYPEASGDAASLDGATTAATWGSDLGGSTTGFQQQASSGLDTASSLQQLRAFVDAQCEADPDFGKITRPLPWDGVLTSDEDSPLGSPRLRLGSGKKAAKTAAKQPLKGGPQQIQGLVDSLSKTAGNALGATWLDKIRQNLAEERARAVAQAAAEKEAAAAAEAEKLKAAKAVAAKAAAVKPRSPKPQAAAPPAESAASQRPTSKPTTPVSQRSHRSQPQSAKQPFGGVDVMSLHSSPRSPAPAIPASPPPPSPPKATQQQGNGTAAPPVAGEEKDPPQPVHESPFAAHGAEGWDLGEEQGWELPPEGGPANVDPLVEEAQALPPVQIKPTTPGAHHDPTPPINSSRALIAEVEDLKRQLAEALGEAGKAKDSTSQLQDDNSKLALELEDLKTVIDQQTKEAKASKGQENGGEAPEEAARELEERAAALAEEEAQLTAERESLLQENEKLLGEREQLESERDAVAVERETLAAETAVLRSQREVFNGERDALQAERERLKPEQDSLEQLQAQIFEREKAVLAKEVAQKEAAELQAASPKPSGAVRELQSQLRELQAEVEKLRAEHAAMTSENEALADENLAKDEEIEQLTGQLMHAQNELKAGKGGNELGLTPQEVKQLREQANLDFHRIAALDEQNQQLQDRIDELEEAASGAQEQQEAVAKLQPENADLQRRLEAAERSSQTLSAELEKLRAAHDTLSTKSAEAAELAAAFEKERDGVTQQIEALSGQRETLAKENAALKKRIVRAEAKAKQAAEQVAEADKLRKELAAAQEAATQGAEALAENDSLASRLAAANMRAAAAEADVEAAREGEEKASEEAKALRSELQETKAAKEVLEQERDSLRKSAEEESRTRQDLTQKAAAAQKALKSARREQKEAAARVSELEAENGTLLSKIHAAEAGQREQESKVSELQEQLRSLQDAHSALQAQLEAAAAAGGEAANSGQLKEQLEEKEADFEELVVCLGAESAKVEALAEILEKQGMDVQAFLDEIEEKHGYGFDEEGGEEGEEQEEGNEPQEDEPQEEDPEAGQPAFGEQAASPAKPDVAAQPDFPDQPDLSWLEDPLEGAEGDWGL